MAWRIPHLRVPVVIDVPKPMLGVFFTREPIDMGAMDGKPVHTLFLLLQSHAKATPGIAGPAGVPLPPAGICHAPWIEGNAGRNSGVDSTCDAGRQKLKMISLFVIGLLLAG